MVQSVFPDDMDHAHRQTWCNVLSCQGHAASLMSSAYILSILVLVDRQKVYKYVTNASYAVPESFVYSTCVHFYDNYRM